jgi:hypothetical protein
MPTALWVSLGVAAGAGALACLIAFCLKRGFLASLSPSSPHRLGGPHRQAPRSVPERYASRQVAGPGDWISVPGLTKTEAEELLDWLEANGFTNRELIPTEDRFTVRYS